ncbi:farnesol dehydrogenase-like [Vespula squamosa]|uniref:Farnesol dehydrogenase-like n=1 Tax=Vespula squamosa TaxID=30214 RepID=A0ABD2A079_VESSQ
MRSVISRERNFNEISLFLCLSLSLFLFVFLFNEISYYKQTIMERWAGKIAVVTGASSGMGLAIAKALVQNEVVVIGFARRKSKMQSEMQNVKGKSKGKFYACECDITKTESIEQAFQWVKNNFGTVHILVNNAGISSDAKFMDSSRSDWQRLFDINVLGYIDCSKRAAKMMLDSNEECYIVNMNSILGHNVDLPGFTLNFYPSSKFASVAATEIIQKELYGIAIVTGASSGIGLAIAKAFVQNEIVVVGFARRKSKMQSEMQNVKGKGKGKFYACECDVTKPESIEQAFQWVKNNFGTVHILVNNAGVSSNAKFMDSSRPDWQRLFDVNVLGYIDCTKRAARMMLDSNVEGYIVNMNSIAGHYLDVFPDCSLNFYPASKHASVAATEITQKELHGKDIANAVIYVIGTPQRVHITELIIRPFGEVQYQY